MPTNPEPTLAPLFARLFTQPTVTTALLSGPRARLPESVLKVEITRILLRGEPHYQFAYHQARKVTHRNLTPAAAQPELLSLLATQFKQAVFHSGQGDVVVTLNKRFEAIIRERGKKEGGKERGGQEAGGGEQETEAAAGGEALPSFPPSLFPLSLTHDRPKNHLLPEGQPLAFLVGLGVMTEDGRVIAARRDKFRQINRFLEMVADVVAPLQAQADARPERPLGIVDFGCGKAYLTFALYHYLHTLRGLDITLVGVDVKADVLAQCAALAAEIGYTGLHFVTGDIQNCGPELKKYLPTMQMFSGHYTPDETLPAAHKEPLSREQIAELTRQAEELIKQQAAISGSEAEQDAAPPEERLNIDMVVALHACDTATDDALAQAVAWGAQVILAAPCCQHELRSKIQNKALAPMLRHGIVRERLSALVTDTLRAEFLGAFGYTAQMLEFIEAEHTPKNILLRAVQKSPAPTPAQSQAAQSQYAQLRNFWQVQPYIEQALARALSNNSPTHYETLLLIFRARFSTTANMPPDRKPQSHGSHDRSHKQ